MVKTKKKKCEKQNKKNLVSFVWGVGGRSVWTGLRHFGYSDDLSFHFPNFGKLVVQEDERVCLSKSGLQFVVELHTRLRVRSGGVPLNNIKALMAMSPKGFLLKNIEGCVFVVDFVFQDYLKRLFGVVGMKLRLAKLLRLLETDCLFLHLSPYFMLGVFCFFEFCF